MPADEDQKPDIPLIEAVIAWTPHSDQIEVRRSRTGDWPLPRDYARVAGDIDPGWRELHHAARWKAFRALVDRIADDDVCPTTAHAALSRIPQYRSDATGLGLDRRRKLHDPRTIAQHYRRAAWESVPCR